MATPTLRKDALRQSLDEIFSTEAPIKTPIRASLDEIFSSEPQQKPQEKPQAPVYAQPGKRSLSRGSSFAPSLDVMPTVRSLSDKYGNDVYQVGGATIGAGLGSVAGGPVGTLLGGWTGGVLGRSLGSVMKNVAKKQPIDTNEAINQARGAAIGETLGPVTAKGLEASAPLLKSGARRLMNFVIRPTGKLAPKSEQIAETALSEGLFGPKKFMREQTEKKINELNTKLDSILQNNQSQTINPKDVLSELDSLEKEYASNLDDAAVQKIKELRSAAQDVQGVGKRPITVTEAQANKQGQYATLKRKKIGGGYGAETNSAEVEGRQALARGYRKGIENALPAENISGINADESNLINVRRALGNRIAVSARSNPIGLPDVILGGATLADHRVLPFLVGRKLLSTDTANTLMAQGLYQGSKALPKLSEFANNPVSRALAARALAYQP